jgi:hypothetical protein
MTSMAEQLGDRAPGLAEMRAAVTGELVALLGYEGFDETSPGVAWGFQTEAELADETGTGAHPDPIVSTEGVPKW